MKCLKKIIKVNGEKDIGALIISLIISEGIGILGGLFGGNSSGAYQDIIRPSFSPPGWIFGVVWPILYLLMGIAAYRVWMVGKQGKDVKKALTFYGIQLFLNFIWSILFFRYNLIGLALIEIVILLVFIIITTIMFFRIDKKAGWLMVPYILWVSFATVLNYSIYVLNS